MHSMWDTRHSPRTPTFVHLCSCRQVCPAHPPKTRTVWTHCLRGIFLLHCPGSRLHQTLSGILPCEARTFLSCSLSALTAATICPAQNISKFIRFQRKLQVLSPCFFILFLRIRFCTPGRTNKLPPRRRRGRFLPTTLFLAKGNRRCAQHTA